ncbi:PRC-barrel domain-containing protein [Streptomyces sp. P9-A2]|uniref:PRC-barrel domain-containing protein n=1 Tax=Streptomyces sp. P9-A2 TaxID=3072284 RepID=UPI002FC819EE
MSELLAVRSLSTLPVVTLGGDAVAHVKDTVLDVEAGCITGFTLTSRTLLAGSPARDLPWPAAHSLGRHAVMVRDKEALCDLPLSVSRRDALRGRLLRAQVLTDEGDRLGTVLDVLVEGGTSGRIVAFRLAAHRGLVPGSRHRQHRRHRVYVPYGEAVSVSGRSLVVPAHITAYVTDDLPDFVARAGAFHARRTGVLP